MALRGGVAWAGWSGLTPAAACLREELFLEIVRESLQQRRTALLGQNDEPDTACLRQLAEVHHPAADRVT